MASPAPKQSSLTRRCAGLLSRVAYRHAAHRGVDVDNFLTQAGLTKAEIENPNTPISVVNQIKFVDLVAQALGDELLGFHLAEGFDFREIGMLYYVAASADTLGSALCRAERYIKLQNEGVRFRVSKGKTVRIRLLYTGVPRHSDVHQIGAIITVIIRILRQLTDRSLAPTRVRIMHRIAGDKSGLEKFLESKIEDGADVDEIELPTASWDLPIQTADPHLHRLCVQNCEEALARREKKASSLKVQVENAIAELLPHGQARHELIAAKLGMSARTLARRLSSESASFAAILENVRSSLAQRYLADRALPISEIAWLLGYAEIGTFTRAYQRWTGIPPSAARAQNQVH